MYCSNENYWSSGKPGIFFFITLSNFKLFSHCSSTHCVSAEKKRKKEKFKRTGLVDISQKLKHHGNRLLLILLEILSSFFFFFISLLFLDFWTFPLAVAIHPVGADFKIDYPANSSFQPKPIQYKSVYTLSGIFIFFFTGCKKTKARHFHGNSRVANIPSHPVPPHPRT